ncbi:MAG: N-6 DNA methylase [Planctomycetaceae bacterium]|nr:N-6 DNA methylase [Planctomycetaceae bacterium]
MKLYAFCTPDIAKHDGYLKIGETHGDVDQRVRQQGHELNVENKIVWHNAVITERRGIDKMVHRYLVVQGFDIQQFDETGQDTEWVKCTVADLEKAFAAVREQLYQDEIKRRELGDKFYCEIRNWYYWTNPMLPDSDAALRIIVRLLFCRFLQEKGLIPQELFQESFLREHLKENEEYRYYNAVLRNLFFHCLNTPIHERGDVEHKNLIKNPRLVKEQFSKIPFLNGGLFDKHEGDDFQLSHRYFFSEEETHNIPEMGGKFKVSGIIRILSQYHYKLTLDDLMDHEEYVKTVDPEFIGKVFESLLACIDADSKETRRKVSGSYYTPREVVDYMVSEALDAYLQHHDDLLECKILDPACGSGAFPCGVMNEIIRRIDPERKLTQTERYRRKLDIVRKVIYGVDIQPIAVQISLFRFFLSLIQEIVPNHRKEENYGIEPLPNLETKFLCADSLIGLKNGEKNGQRRLELPIIKETILKLQRTRSEYFMARTLREKKTCRREDEAHRGMLEIVMKDSGDMSHETAEKLVAWNPYNPSNSASFFDPMWMFGVEKFDIIIGNPPYGAKYSETSKKYFLKNYETAKTIPGKQKGSLDTFSLFIERGWLLCKDFGFLHFIVPISITSSDSMTGVHRLLERSCSLIKVSSYAVRPQPVFENAVVNSSILFCQKDGKTNEQILATKMYRKSKNQNLGHLLKNLQFIDVKNVKLTGRYPKISLKMEKRILKKILALPVKIRDMVQETGQPIFYRTTGGRYFKVVTNYPTGSTQEKSIFFDKKTADTIGAILSSDLFFWFYQVFSDNLHIKQFEIFSFGIPVDQITLPVRRKLERLYARYLEDIERNANLRHTERYSNIDSFKEYKIGKSKHLIDQIDDIICPLYGLTQKETDFIKNYEIDFRLSDGN